MCVTVLQFAGYSVPFKKVQFTKIKHNDYNELFRGIETWNHKDYLVIFAINKNESICECEDENGDEKEFIRETYRLLSFDEDDIILYEEKKKKLFSTLEQVGLGRYAIYGVYTDTKIDHHL